MSCLYLVKTDFADAAREPEWQEWYSGPKQDWLLSRPGFRAGQRFEAVSSTDGIRYLAAYALESSEALKTPEYKSSWGWADYRPAIINWTRNLFDIVDADRFLTPDGALLKVVLAEAPDVVDGLKRMFPELEWGIAAGELDSTFAAIGVGRGTADEELPQLESAVVGVYRPVSPARRAEPVEAADAGR